MALWVGVLNFTIIPQQAWKPHTKHPLTQLASTVKPLPSGKKTPSNSLLCPGRTRFFLWSEDRLAMRLTNPRTCSCVFEPCLERRVRTPVSMNAFLFPNPRKNCDTCVRPKTHLLKNHLDLSSYLGRNGSRRLSQTSVSISFLQKAACATRDKHVTLSLISVNSKKMIKKSLKMTFKERRSLIPVFPP